MALVTFPARRTIADLLEGLGGIAPTRVLLDPAPGTASEKDVIDADSGGGRLCELVDGALVEKAMGFRESLWAAVLIGFLEDFLRRNDVGIVAGADGALRLMPGLVRIPDVAFISWDRLPGREVPQRPIPDLAPDLVVEILSEGNTPAEMKRKLREYFQAGVRSVWYAKPADQTVRVHSSPRRSFLLGAADTLNGGDLLPGFALPLREWFDRAERRAPVRP